MFEDLLFPYIGSRPITALTPPELLEVFRRLERRGKNETAHRIKQRVGQVAPANQFVRSNYVRGHGAPASISRHAAGAKPCTLICPIPARTSRNVGKPTRAVKRRTWRFLPSRNVSSSHAVGILAR